ncbi:cytochrome P450 [Roridomyces roridus]|uniref:Cytochrome P450 n=1 Tax=Roridomyces roridus TaxID=1738132 RepID=A0AAD7FDE9_9AGAR|nr:cytochrome P450 [Roridomyces roridus]
MGLVFTFTALLAGAFLLRLHLLRRRSAIGFIPGPPSSSLLFGNGLDISVCNVWGQHEFDWQKKYGPVYRVKGCMGIDQLMVSDPHSVQHICTSSAFAMPPNVGHIRKTVFGKLSVLTVTGESHRRLRTALNPAFSSGSVRKLIPLLGNTATMLTSDLEKSLLPNTETIDMSPILAKATLSAITEAVFGCSFTDLDDEQVSFLSDLFATFGPRRQAQFLVESLMQYIPAFSLDLFNLFTPAPIAATISAVKKMAQELGTRTLNQRLQSEGLEMNDDLFGILAKQMSGKGGLSYDEILAQTLTLLVGGQDTIVREEGRGKDVLKMIIEYSRG